VALFDQLRDSENEVRRLQAAAREQQSGTLKYTKRSRMKRAHQTLASTRRVQVGETEMRGTEGEAAG
jgi:hypothetical protein